MFSYGRKQPSMDDDIDMDTSYHRALKSREPTLDSNKPFDEASFMDDASFSEESARLDSLVAAGSNVSSAASKASVSKCGSNLIKESVGDGPHSVQDNVSVFEDGHSKAESRNPSLGNHSNQDAGSTRNSTLGSFLSKEDDMSTSSTLSTKSHIGRVHKMAKNSTPPSSPDRRSHDPDDVSMYSATSLSEHGAANDMNHRGSRSARSTPSSLSGGESLLMGMSQYTKEGENATIKTAATTNYNDMTTDQAEEAYHRICCQNRYDGVGTPSPGPNVGRARADTLSTVGTSSPTRSVASGGSGALQGRARADTISTAGSASPARSTASGKSTRDTAQADGLVDATKEEDVLTSSKFLSSCSMSFPDPQAVLSFGAESQCSAMTVQNATLFDKIYGIEEGEEGQQEEKAMNDGLMKVEQKNELRANMLEEEIRKGEANGKVVRVRLGKSGTEGEGGDNVKLAKLMTTGSLDTMRTLDNVRSIVNDSQGQIKKAKSCDASEDKVAIDIASGKITLDNIIEEDSDEPEEEGVAEEEEAPPEEATSTQESSIQEKKPHGITQDEAAAGAKLISSSSHSHSSRGAFAFAKLKSKNLKSKRLFGKKKTTCDVVEPPKAIAVLPVHINDVQDEDEIELTFGSIHSLPDGVAPTSASSTSTGTANKDVATAAAEVKGIDTPNYPAKVDNEADKAAPAPESSVRSLDNPTSTILKDLNDGATSISVNDETKDGTQLSHVQSNRTDDTRSATVDSRLEDEFEDATLIKDAIDLTDAHTMYSVYARDDASSCNRGIGPAGLLDKLFTWGAGPFQCKDVACNGIFENGGSSRESLIDLYECDDFVDEALNVEMSEDEYNVTHVGGVNQEELKSPQEPPSKQEGIGENSPVKNESTSSNNGNETVQPDDTPKTVQVKDMPKTVHQAKDMPKTGSVPSCEVNSKEGEGGDIIPGQESVKVDDATLKPETRAEKGSSNAVAVGSLKAKKTGLRMKLLTKMKKKVGVPATTPIASATLSSSQKKRRGFLRRKMKAAVTKRGARNGRNQQPADSAADAILEDLIA